MKYKKMKDSIRAGYEQLGVEGYYKKYSETYSNPHLEEIEYLMNKLLESYDIGNHMLDMCCGSGEITKIILQHKGTEKTKTAKIEIEGLDPFTYKAYQKNTNKSCLTYDFKDIVKGALQSKQYDTIICSFAMHLCEESMLNNLLYQLSLIANTLIIITPHKRPEINNWWKEIDRFKYNKTTLKIYKRSI